MPERVEIDGSQGEGGGQILRSALSLSLITGRPFVLNRVRALRIPGGLRPQHLACVRGAEAISGARSEGAEVGSSTLSFTPGRVLPGDYLLEIGTAGSTPLLLQCLLYPLALAGGGTLTLRGGTHLPHSPCYPYLSSIWLPLIQSFGFRANLSLVYAGFYPEGAGEIRAQIGPLATPPERMDLASRGALRDMDVSSSVGGMPFQTAERQSRAAVNALRERGIYCHAENVPLPTTRSAGSVTFVRAQFERTFAGFTALGQRGWMPERVGQEAVESVASFMESGGAVDSHQGDQILLPASLLAAGYLSSTLKGRTRYRPSEVTGHLLSQVELIQQFLDVRIQVGTEDVQVDPA